MKLLLILLVGCASVPPVSTDVCYTRAENAALSRALTDQNDAIDELNAQIRRDKRKADALHTRTDGLKGYCT